MKQRDEYVDVAKGICIMLIVCIHAEVFGVIGMPFTFIAVPMFFFMSGFYDRSSKPIEQWLGKSLISLILPAIIWISIGLIYSILLQSVKGKIDPVSFDINNIATGNGPAWFLFALLYAKICTWAMLKTKLNSYVLLPLSFVVGYIGSTYQMPLFVDEGLASVPLYFTGKLVYPRIKEIYKNKLFLLGGIVCLAVFLMHYVYYTIVPLGNGCYKPYYLLAILVTMMVFLPVLYLSEKLICLNILGKLGRRSLGIMLLHAPMCHTAAVILNRVFEKGTAVWVICFIIAYFIIIGVSYFFTLIIENYCPILLGKKK